MAAEKITALTDLAGAQLPTALMYVGISPFGLTDDRKTTLNDLFSEITKNITTVDLQFGNGASAATVSAAGKGKLRYNNTTGTFQASLNGAAYTNLLTGSGTATRVAFWSGAGVISSDAAYYWDNTNKRLSIGSGTSPTAPLDVLAQASDAAAQTWREFSAGPTRVQMQVQASFGLLGTTTTHAFGLMANGTQFVNVESGGAVVIGSILAATAELMVNSLGNTNISLIANNTASTSVDIARFQVNASNRFRFTQNGEAIFGLASSVTGKLTLSNASGATLTSISAGNAATTLNFIWPVIDPSAGQVLSASAPSGGNVTLSWVSGGGGGATINPTDTVFPYRLNSGAFDDSNLIRLSTSVTELRNISTGTMAQTLNIYGTAGNNSAAAPTTYVRAAFSVSSSAVSLTAQQASSGALTAGTNLNLTAANALAGSTGAAAGGSINLTSGSAVQLTSGTARGGDVEVVIGASVGTNSTTALGQFILPALGRYDCPSLCFRTSGFGLLRQYGMGLTNGGSVLSITAPTTLSLCVGDSAQTFTAGVVLMNTQTQLGWVSGTSNPFDFTQDVGIGRSAAGVIRITDGTTGQGSLLIAPSTATATAPLDVVAQASDATAQTWREFSGGPTRVKMQVQASFGLLGTTTAHAFGLMANGTQFVNVESGGAVVVGSILAATAELMVNSLGNTNISLIANNTSGTSVDIARFQVNASNRFRFTQNGEAIFGLASSVTGKLTLSNASGATLTSISAGNAATTLNFIWPVVDPTAGQVLSASAPSSGNVTLSWATNGGSSALTSTQIGFGDGSNLLSGSTRLIWDNTNRSMTLGESGNSGQTQITLRSSSTVSAFIAGSAAVRPGSQGGLILPNVGGDQSQGPGVWWTDGNYNGTSGLYLSLGLNWQGYDTGGQALRLRKSTATSTQGDVIFEFRPNDGYVQLAPFGTSAGNTTELHFMELLANGTNYVALKAPDAIGSTNPVIVLPSSATPTVNQVLSVSAVSGGVITTTWATASGSGITGSGTNGQLTKWLSAGVTIADSIVREDTGPTTLTIAGRTQIDGITISTDATNTVGGLTVNGSFTKNNTNTRTFYTALFKPTFNTGGSNTATTINILGVDTVNTAVTGLTVNLLNLAYGGTTKFSIDSNGGITFNSGVRQAFSPDTTTPGLNVGTVSGDPSSPTNGDLWYDLTNNLLRARINSATVTLGAAGGSGITVGTTTITGGVSTSIPYNNAGVYGETNLTFASSATTLTNQIAVNTVADGFVLTNTATVTSSGNERNSPRIRFTGAGWRTTATAASRVVDFTIDLQPLDGTTNPANRLVVSQQVNAGGFSTHSVFGVSQTGISYLSVPGGSETEWPGLTIGANFSSQASPVINGFYADPGGSYLIVRPANRFGAHGSGFTLLSGATLAWSNNAASITTGTDDLFVRRAGSANLQLGAANAASPVNQTLSTQGSRGGTDTNVSGANLTVQSGLGTGNATPSSLFLKSPLIGSTGTTAQTAVTGLTILNGAAVLTNYTVANLPSAATCGAGALAFVTDATLTAITGLGVSPTGGGSNKVPVYSDGTNWIII